MGELSLPMEVQHWLQTLWWCYHEEMTVHGCRYRACWTSHLPVTIKSTHVCSLSFGDRNIWTLSGKKQNKKHHIWWSFWPHKWDNQISPSHSSIIWVRQKKYHPILSSILTCSHNISLNWPKAILGSLPQPWLSMIVRSRCAILYPDIYLNNSGHF